MDAIRDLHHSLPPFAPLVPTALLPFLAAALLLPTFALAFYTSTLPTNTFSPKEPILALVTSSLGAFGVVTLFCAVGVYL